MIEAPNALLLLQVVHFIIAYLVLKYVLLKPGLKVLRSIDDADRSIKRDLALLKEEVDLQGALVKDQWGRHCVVLRSRMPVPFKGEPDVIARVTSAYPSLDGEAEQRLVADLKNVVVEAVSGEHQCPM